MLPSITFIFYLGLIIFTGTILAFIVKALKQPLLIAYIIAGILIGPYGFDLITDLAEITLLAELGIAFLLFTIGLEINLQKLRVVGVSTILGATIQIILTFIIGFWLAIFLGFNSLISIYIGLLFAFSSTMIVAKIFVDKNELTTLHGRITIGILLIQDILVIPAILFLSNVSMTISPYFIGTIALKVLFLIGFTLFLNKYVFKRILDWAAKTKEILFFTAVTVCFLFIGLAYYLKFSIAIGAFFGGLAMAKFPYNVEIFGEMRSLRDFFSVLFFASLGMQLNFGFLFTMGYYFIILLLGIIIIKPLILFFIYLALGYGGRTSSAIGFSLGQASEFSFIIGAHGLLLGHFSRDINSMILGLVVISMIITPYLMHFHNSIYNVFSKKKFINKLNPFKYNKLGLVPKRKLKDHIVVFGCGTTGAIIIKYLENKKENFIVLEHDPEIVNTLNKNGIYCLYGEADNEAVLKKIGLFDAKIAIIAIPDIAEACFAIKKAKELNPKIKILARANTVIEEKELIKAGVESVIVPKIVSAYTITRRIGKFLK